jgi:hypothetical protein
MTKVFQPSFVIAAPAATLHHAGPEDDGGGGLFATNAASEWS